MSDYISKETIQKICMEERSDFGDSAVDRIWRRIKTFPSADVRENIHGEWIIGGYDDMNYVCSKCGYKASEYYQKPKFNFCPNCGADMRGENETDN